MEALPQDLADFLVTKNFDPEYFDDQGQPSEAGDAVTIKFDYVADSGKNYGTAVCVISNDELSLYYGDNLGRGMEPEDKDDWYSFLEQLSNTAASHSATWTPTEINKLKHNLAGIAAIKEGLFEGYYGNRRVSYMGEQTQARLVINHNRVLGEDDKRYRYVESLFIETADQERFRLSFKSLAGGRAMLEHVRSGGRPYDVRGNHIAEIVGEMAVLSRFNRAQHHRVYEGVTQELVESARQYYHNLQETMKHLGSPRGYQAYFESWAPDQTGEAEALVENLRDLFVEQTLDARIEAALPTLAKIQQQGNNMKEAQIFENWINNLTAGTWALPETPEQMEKLNQLMSAKLLVGPDATNATELLYDIVGDKELFEILEDLADKSEGRANIWDDSHVQRRLAELGIQTPQSTQAEPADVPQDEAPAAAPPVAEDSGDSQLTPGMKTQYGTVVSLEGNTVTVRASNGELTTVNIHDIQQGVAEGWAKNALAGAALAGAGALGSAAIQNHNLSTHSHDAKKPAAVKVAPTADRTQKDISNYKLPSQDEIDKRLTGGYKLPSQDEIDKRLTGGYKFNTAKAELPPRNMRYNEATQGMAEGPDGYEPIAHAIEQYITNHYNGKHGLDTDDFMKVAGMVRNGSINSARKFASTLDTDPRDKLLSMLGQGVAEGDNMSTFAEDRELAEMLKYAGVPLKEGVLTDSTGSTMDHIQDRFRRDIKDFTETGDMSDDLYDALYDYYFDDMPYAVRKAKSNHEDQYQWIGNRFADDLGIDEGAIGAALGGIAGAAITKSPAGASVGSSVGDAITDEGWKGALTGAALGGALGSIVPGLGTIQGAIAGGYAGHRLDDVPLPASDKEYNARQELEKQQQKPVSEGSCNMTMEGSYCPEHGLAECGGMYEDGGAVGMPYSMGEGVAFKSQEGDALLARIKSLALLR